MPLDDDRFAGLIVLAAGRSARFGGDDKTLLPLAGAPAILYSIRAGMSARTVAEIIVVVSPANLDEVSSLIDSDVVAGGSAIPVSIVLGGDRRQDSVFAGLSATGPVEIVLVHDGARPLVTSHLLDRCASAARTTGAAIVATPINDTLKRVSGHRVAATVPRDNLWAAQTPQAARRDVLIDGFAEAHRRRIDVTDEAMLLELLDVPIAVVEGPSSNVKLTRPADVAVIEALIAAAQPAPGHAP